MNDILRHISDSVILNALMENVADSIYFKDRQRRLIWVSNKMVTDLGFEGPGEIIGKTDAELFGEEFNQKTRLDDLRVMETGKPIIGQIESRELPDGKTNWTSTSKLPIHNDKGEIIGLLGITREINELKQVEQDLQYLATHDILTSLPNRFLLFDSLEQAIRRAKRNKTQFVVLYIDLDSFKSVNDRHGHEIGDKLLKKVASRLSASVRDSDRVARLGGDEFAVLLEDMGKPADALKVAEKIRKAISKKVDFLAKGEGVKVSIGVAFYPADGKSVAAVLGAADHAMYKAKKKGNTSALFSISKSSK